MNLYDNVIGSVLYLSSSSASTVQQIIIYVTVLKPFNITRCALIWNWPTHWTDLQLNTCQRFTKCVLWNLLLVFAAQCLSSFFRITTLHYPYATWIEGTVTLQRAIFLSVGVLLWGGGGRLLPFQAQVGQGQRVGCEKDSEVVSESRWLSNPHMSSSALTLISFPSLSCPPHRLPSISPD